MPDFPTIHREGRNDNEASSKQEQCCCNVYFTLCIHCNVFHNWLQNLPKKPESNFLQTILSYTYTNEELEYPKPRFQYELKYGSVFYFLIKTYYSKIILFVILKMCSKSNNNLLLSVSNA